MTPEKQAVLDMLNAERYGKPLWWETPAKPDIPQPHRSDWCFLADHPRCKSPYCRCECHAETPAVERDSRSANGKMGATEKTTPGGASTPTTRGLADEWSVD